MTATDVQVRVDDRMRLMGALLAASEYFELSQARKKYGLHAYARALRKRVAPLAGHEAVRDLNNCLEDGFTLADLYAPLLDLDAETLRLAAHSRPAGRPWTAPELWLDFAQQAHLQDAWREEAGIWERSVAETERVLTGAALGPFLGGYFGTTTKQLVFMPNIGFPADQEVAPEARAEYIAIVPPRPAWGDSPPWPFDEDPAYLLRAAILAFSWNLLWDTLGEQTLEFSALLDTDLPVSGVFRLRYPGESDQLCRAIGAGLVAIYLEDQLGSREAKAYLLLEKRMNGLDLLPAAMQVLRAYRADPLAGTPGALRALLFTFAYKVRGLIGK